MPYINQPHNFTLTPPADPRQQMAVFQSITNSRRGGMSFDEAARINSIYRGNCEICRKQMCNSIAGIDSLDGCPSDPHWNQIQEFCGVCPAFTVWNPDRNVGIDRTIGLAQSSAGMY